MVYETERLIVREYRPEDAPAAFRMYGNPEVMRYLGGGKVQKSVEQSRELIERVQKRYQETPVFGYWAMEDKASGEVVGTVLLKPLPNSELYEVGWHLAPQFEGNGYATEAARGALAYGFDNLGLETIYAVLFAENKKSWRVTERLGMTHIGPTSDFYDVDLEMFEVKKPA